MQDDWSPGAYDAFRGFRLRPALDLLAAVPADLPDGEVVDLGCGSGAAAAALRARFPGRRIAGVDASPAMLAEARATGVYAALTEADAGAWTPAAPPALLFSNACLQWLPDHARLMPRLAGLLAPGGCLAVQMPRQHRAASHRLIREVAARMFPGRFPPDGAPAVAPPEVYARSLGPLGQVTVWETEYLQRLAPAQDGHPVRRFTQSTAMRPLVARLSAEETARYLAACDAALAEAYPAEPDGTVLFPFRRLFFVLAV